MIKEQYLVIANKPPRLQGIGNNMDAIYYCGDSELEAYSKYRTVKMRGNARVVFAKVDRDAFGIVGYEILKVVKNGTPYKKI